MVIIKPLFNGIAERFNTFMTISWRLSVQVGDLVKVIAEGLHPLTGTIGLITDMQPHTDSLGTVFYCLALMAGKKEETYKFRVEHLEVISPASQK
jgi:hypothetical protein